MKPIYVSHEHEVIVDSYLKTVYSSIREVVSEDAKYNDFKDIANIIIEYHNNFSSNRLGNFYDFLLIIPINFSTMVSGFLCGYETKDNAAIVKIHRALIYEFSLRVITELNEIQPEND